MYSKDERTVITLDAGGSNFDFSAIRGNKIVVEKINKPAYAHGHPLQRCIDSIIEGFEEVTERLQSQGLSATAISFAFPGPADYLNGIIGPGFIPAFPEFREGVALGRLLEKRFNVPVFINNDADLFVYGEALAGALPRVNQRLKDMGSCKQYRNLIGFTWGTGFGFGFTVNGQMHLGDNSCTEIFCLPHKKRSDMMVEDGVSARAIKRVYGEFAGDKNHHLEPADIYAIAEGTRPGAGDAARQAFAEMGEIAGHAIATAVSLIDGIVVIGGGLRHAAKYIKPALFQEMNRTLSTLSGDRVRRLQSHAYDLDDDLQFAEFAKGETKNIQVKGYNDCVTCNARKSIGVTISTLDASVSVSLGAYAFALHEIDSAISNPVL
ncbi:MAG: ROK family protein [Bacteroidales bacterium]|jgi:predicted NBD/HSP70 family sugar kinase|nr:ROK family protein [Bacteroidales bacterium]